MALINRDNYLDKLKSLRDKHIIKIITGVRRCGKSTLLELFRDYLVSTGVPSDRILAINFEDFDNYKYRDPSVLYEHIKKSISESGEMHYLLLDEIQQVQNFSEVIDSLFLKNNVDLYVTGSNANLLSSEIATLISGRYIEIEMLPLSFKEFVRASGNGESDLQKKYSDYITFGSFPFVNELNGDEALVKDYLTGIYNTIVLKDVMFRKNISDNMMLESVVGFLFDNIGNALSTKRIADIMTSSGRKIDVKTLEKYISALVDSFVLYKARRYNVKGGQILKTMEKYYGVDVGLRNLLLSSRSFDAGRILENVVYLELLRRGNKVFVGKINNLEVDFVCINQEGVSYYQVAATGRDETTLSRELSSLEAIRDHYPKTILTLDEDPDADYNGIRRVNALKWLLSK
ncbi:MAG: ATP-binding protein [Bacteroidales bacterium]